MSVRRRRSGFTLAEVAVSAAIVAMLAAVTVPYLATFLDKQRVQTTAERLAALSDGIAAFASSVRTTAASTSTAYPGLISELSNQIVLNNTANHNSCGSGGTGTYNSTATTTWSGNGPFVNFYIPAGGMKTPLGMVSDSMLRSLPNTSAGTLAIRMIAVDTADTNLLDLVIDGGDGGLAGTLRFTLTGSGATRFADIQYLVPIAAKC